jgi:hypothetical protein
MLDVNQLSEMGCLRPGCSSVCRWINVAASGLQEQFKLDYAIHDFEWSMNELTGGRA